MVRVLIRCSVLILPVMLLWSSVLHSAPTDKAEAKAKTSPIELIKKALDENTTIDYANQPLPTVLSSIGEEHKINIVLDRMAIQTSGVEPMELMVDVHIKNTKLRNGLRTLLNQYSLSFGIIGDQLFVSTEDNVIARQLKQRISLEIDEVPLSKVLKDISKEYAVNILIDPRSIKEKKSDEKVSLSLEDVPLETAVRLACEIGNLKPVRMGNVIFVTSEVRADRLKDQDLAPATSNPGVYPGATNPGIGINAAPAAVPGNAAPPIVEAPKEKE